MSALETRIGGWIKRIVMGAMIASGVTLLAFGPRANRELPQDRVIVDYWEKWTGDEETDMRQIVSDFNNTVGVEKHIFVRYLSTSGIEQKTLVATAGGVPPDIAGLYNQDIPQFSSMDSLQPLDELARQYGITRDKYKKVFWDECCFNGRLYGLVSSAYDLALYYNTTIFRQQADKLRAAGLDPTRAPRSIAELDRYAKALDKIDPSGRIEFAGFIPTEPGWYTSYYPIWFGGFWWNRATRQFTFTDPNVLRAFQWVNSYAKRLGPGELQGFQASFGAFDSPTNSFLAPTVAMVQQGTFFAHFIRHQKPSFDGQWAAAPFPSDDPRIRDATYCNCDVLCIPRGAKHKEQAFEFIAYVNRQDVMEKLANLMCKISPLSKVSPQFLEHHNNPYIKVFDELAASPFAHPTEPIPILNEVTDEFNEFIQALTLQRVTPEEGLRRLQERVQQKYAEFAEDQAERHRQQATN